MTPVLCLAALAALPPVEAPRPAGAAIVALGEAFVADRPYLAVVVGVSTPAGRRVYGFGSVDRDGRRVPPDGKTVYEIGSVTKTFTGTLLADLVREGAVKLDDPVRAHLPDGWTVPTRDGRDVTLLHLATHTSSLPRLPPGLIAGSFLTLTPHDPYRNYDAAALKHSLARIELDRPIGSRYEYSNLGAGLLGFALAHAAKTDVDSLFRDRLFAPLGMTDTAFATTDGQRSRLAPPFAAGGLPGNEWAFDALKTAGGLRSTADDLLNYAEAALGRTDTPLRPAFASATQPWRQTCNGGQSVGLGWHVEPFAVPGGTGKPRTTTLVAHNGATGAYRATVALLPERGVAVVILSNSADPFDAALLVPVLRAVASPGREK